VKASFFDLYEMWFAAFNTATGFGIFPRFSRACFGGKFNLKKVQKEAEGALLTTSLT